MRDSLAGRVGFVAVAESAVILFTDGYKEVAGGAAFAKEVFFGDPRNRNCIETIRSNHKITCGANL